MFGTGPTGSSEHSLLLNTLPQGPIVHTDHSDLVLDEEGALETKVSVGNRGVPFTGSLAISLFGPLPFHAVAPQMRGLAPPSHFLLAS